MRSTILWDMTISWLQVRKKSAQKTLPKKRMIKDQQGNILEDIIRLCLAIDTSAHAIYHKLHTLFRKKELTKFWKKMAAEENDHIKFWESLIPLVKKNMLPQIFDRPYQVRDDLMKIKNIVQGLSDSLPETPDPDRAFIIAYRLEFYLVHTAFETLFHFSRELEKILNIKSPGINYETHIKTFIQTLKKHGYGTPEMELLGETLIRLWRENRELAIQGNTDSLTTVLNRRGFFNSINPIAHLARRNSQKIGILMIDIDDFKRINDTYGHQRGDQILLSVAAAIKKKIRESDICGRYGGEEFIVFLSNIKPNTTRIVGEAIRKAIKNIDCGTIQISASIGGYEGFIEKNVDDSVSLFISRADECLYKAKNSGKNRVCFDASGETAEDR